MKVSGHVRSRHDPEAEPLKFLGTAIWRGIDGVIRLSQEDYAMHCLRENNLLNISTKTPLPRVLEKIDVEERDTKNYEMVKSLCQKFIGQLLWMVTRTRPDIAPSVGDNASNLVLCPTTVAEQLKHVFAYVRGTMTSELRTLAPVDEEEIKLELHVYSDASYNQGGGRGRTGVAIYLCRVDTGEESMIQCVSKKQGMTATSAPEAELAALAEAASIGMYMNEVLVTAGVVENKTPEVNFIIDTDSQVAMQQIMNGMAVTVRSKPFMNKLAYLRDCLGLSNEETEEKQIPLFRLRFLPGTAQKADGFTKVLTGEALTNARRNMGVDLVALPRVGA